MAARTNFWHNCVHPRNEFQLTHFFWPTDDEMALIDGVMGSKAYQAHFINVYGEALTHALNQHVFRENTSQWAYMAKHLPKILAPGAPLTEATVKQALKDFEDEIVVPWLEKWAYEFQEN